MKRRFLLDNDGSNIFHNSLPEDADLQEVVRETVRECAPDVTTYLLCANAGNCYYPTRIANVDPRAVGLRKALENGHDLFGMFLSAIKQSGRETFITMRMNDVHDPEDKDQWNTPKIRKQYPDAIVGPDEVQAGKASWMSYCMDYSRSEVRGYYLSLIREMAEMYGSAIDGIQLDWMRFPRHLPGKPEEVWKNHGALTAFMTEARQILRQVGTHLQLAARLPPTLEGCRSTGIDFGTWAQQGLVDFIVACPFLTTNWHIPISEYRALMGSMPIPIYAGFDFGYGNICHHPESLRGACSSLYGCGADGIYLFNFPCWTEYLGARPYHWLAGLGDPATAAAKPLQFAVSHKVHRHTITDGPAELPSKLPAGQSLELHLYVPARVLPAWRCMFLTHSHGEVALALNGVPSSPFKFSADTTTGSDGHRSEIFLEFADQYWEKESRPKPQDCRMFKADAALLRPGFNTLLMANRQASELEIERVHMALW